MVGIDGVRFECRFLSRVEVKEQSLVVHKGTSEDTVFASGPTLGPNFDIALYRYTLWDGIGIFLDFQNSERCNLNHATLADGIGPFIHVGRNVQNCCNK